jgi:putative endonuclease
MDTWHVYILQSQTLGIFYIGISNDPYRRLSKHNSGKGAKFTRKGKPWVIVYLEKRDSKSEALKREYRLKQLTRAQKIKLIRDSASDHSSLFGPLSPV